MKTNIIPSSSWKTTNWSGGTTSELLILPKEAEFKKGNYDLRISIATVEVEESTFTALPDVNRILTILNGELELIHEGHHSIVLKQYEQDSFLGDWNTRSIGKVRDFNVMTKDCHADVIVQHLSNNDSMNITPEDFLFLAEGELKNNNISLQVNDSFLSEEAMKFVAVKKSVAILVRLKK